MEDNSWKVNSCNIIFNLRNFNYSKVKAEDIIIELTNSNHKQAILVLHFIFYFH